MAAAAQKLSAALGKESLSQGNGSVLQLKIDQMTKMIAADTEEAAALVKAETDVQIALEQNRVSLDQKSRALDAAKAQEETATAKRERIEGLLAEAQKSLATAQDNYARTTSASGDDEKYHQQAIKDLTSAEALVARRQHELDEATSAANVATVNVRTAAQDLANEQKSGTLAELEATKALKDLKTKQEAEAKKREEAAQAAEEGTTANKRSTKAHNTLADALEEEAKASRERARQAEIDKTNSNYDAALAQINRTIETVRTAAANAGNIAAEATRNLGTDITNGRTSVGSAMTAIQRSILDGDAEKNRNLAKLEKVEKIVDSMEQSGQTNNVRYEAAKVLMNQLRESVGLQTEYDQQLALAEAEKKTLENTRWDLVKSIKEKFEKLGMQD